MDWEDGLGRLNIYFIYRDKPQIMIQDYERMNQRWTFLFLISYHTPHSWDPRSRKWLKYIYLIYHEIPQHHDSRLRNDKSEIDILILNIISCVRFLRSSISKMDEKIFIYYIMICLRITIQDRGMMIQRSAFQFLILYHAIDEILDLENGWRIFFWILYDRPRDRDSRLSDNKSEIGVLILNII